MWKGVLSTLPLLLHLSLCSFAIALLLSFHFTFYSLHAFFSLRYHKKATHPLRKRNRPVQPSPPSDPIPEHLLKQAESLKRGASGVVPENGLIEKLLKSEKTGKPLNIKLGLDPTAPDIHLGFAVVLRKLRQFQDLGHQVIIIIGDYTTLIGDPSGRSATRPMLSPEEIAENATTYVDQLSRVLNRDKTTVRFNGDWLGKLDFAGVVKLASKMTVAQVLQRDDFANRYASHQPISLHELLYPLAQAYDSVAIEADVEMGGQDQTFNILAGRDLQKEMGQDPQIALFMPLLVGLDGVKKMSKSLGNYVGIAESADVMYGKLLSISDVMMRDYFTLCTDVPLEEIDRLIEDVESGAVNPKEIKSRLAKEIIALYHSAEEAERAHVEWNQIHAKGQVPTEMPEFVLTSDLLTESKIWIAKLLMEAGLAKGTGEARRLIDQGGVSLNGEKLTDSKTAFAPASLTDAVIKVGAKRFLRVKTGSLGE
ncbi:MAG: tyrosine--tRNA ligase [Chthonomonadaceae bacterium]|nr:tyrosine--tRNA ligase [Chthonomonadaceae bacterium]